jgi:hypothetical protein
VTDTPDGGPAFPPMIKGAPLGMSLRDWFAGQALAETARDYTATAAALLAYDYADAMLAARKAKP